jgi:hypothetical protein
MSMATDLSPEADQGQIALNRAFFCLECELIFSGATSCPGCAGEAIWPLAEWLQPIRSGATVSKRKNGLMDDSHSGR